MRRGRCLDPERAYGKTGMDEMTAYVVHDPEDRPYAERLVNALSVELRAQIKKAGGEDPSDADVPAVERREGIESLPALGTIGPMAIVLLVLPGRAFAAAEFAKISAFKTDMGRELRLLAVAIKKDRAVPPAPLSTYVSAAIEDPEDPKTRAQLATWLLIQFYLRASSDQKSVFISYRTIDGKAAAQRLEECLAERKYKVFRDERLDADLQKELKWGTEAQKTLADRINEHSVLLLVDTPQAFRSPWVRIEVETAHGLLKPIFPVVVLGPKERPEVVGLGGRFPILRENQAGIFCGPDALTTEGVARVIDQAFLDDLESRLGEHLTRHLYVMRYLVRSAAEQFRSLDFKSEESEEVKGDRLHIYYADRADSMTPWLRFRFLVRCSPYKALVPREVAGMKELLRSGAVYCQYGLLVEPPPTLAFTSFREDLLKDQGGHLLILQADEIRAVARRLLAMEAQL